MADGYSFSALQIESKSKSLQEAAKFHIASSSVQPELEKYCISNPTTINYDAAKLHVVMVPYPVQGQINPMMQFAQLLTAKHDNILVTLVHNKYNHDRIQRSRQMTAANYTSTISSTASSSIIRRNEADSKIRLAWVDNGLPSDFDYNDVTGSRLKEFHLSTVQMKEPLKQLLESLNCNSGPPPVSCVLFGTFCPWAQTAAAELHIPTVLFWTQSATMFSIYYHLPLLRANGFFPYNKKNLPGRKEDDDLVSYIPGLPPLLPSSFPTLLHVDDFSDPSLEIVKEQFSLMGKCDGVIINSFEELEKDAFQALQQELPLSSISLVGPLLPSAFLQDAGNDVNIDKRSGASLLQEQGDCIKWLDGKQKQSVLYISFGSLFNPSTAELEGIAMGVKSSRQPYLWVMRPNSCFRDVSTDVVLPEGFVEDTKDYGLVIPWAPQVEVLSHPSVGAFLTHCGWNSTLESLSMGVPMISLPIFVDQPTNSTYVCDVWKVGMALQRQDNGKVNSEDVEKVVRTVFQEEAGLRMRERAGKLRDAARQAVQAQGSSHIHIGKFIQALKNHAKPRAPAFDHDHAEKQQLAGANLQYERRAACNVISEPVKSSEVSRIQQLAMLNPKSYAN